MFPSVIFHLTELYNGNRSLKGYLYLRSNFVIKIIRPFFLNFITVESKYCYATIQYILSVITWHYLTVD